MLDCLVSWHGMLYQQHALYSMFVTCTMHSGTYFLLELELAVISYFKQLPAASVCHVHFR